MKAGPSQASRRFTIGLYLRWMGQGFRPPVNQTPTALDIVNLNGIFAILGSHFDDRITLSATGSDARVLRLGILMNSYPRSTSRTTVPQHRHRNAPFRITMRKTWWESASTMRAQSSSFRGLSLTSFPA